MRVRVRLFASLAEFAGWREKEVEVADGATVGGVLAELRRGPLRRLGLGAAVLFALNHEHVPADRSAQDGDELGFFPPVSGGSGGPEPEDEPAQHRRTFLTATEISATKLANLLRDPSCGALVTFEGTVRDLNEGMKVRAVDYQAYEEMALPVLRKIRREVETRWPGCSVALAHRTGRLEVGQVSVAVACAAAHRREAFAACRFATDRVKESLPVWKHEEGTTGDQHWR